MKKLVTAVIPKILIGSPVKQKPLILKEFLRSLKELNKTDCTIDYCFVDDCDMPLSSEILLNFAAECYRTIVMPSCSITRNGSGYDLHNWDDKIIDRIAELKNKIIEHARQENYDYLFLIDSDIVLHSETLQRLLSINKDIVSNVFWTKISRWDYYEPQVWLMNPRWFYDSADPRTKNKIFRTAKSMEFIKMLKEKGTYRVGGLGACTLISQKTLKAGVNFSKLYNVDFWGEDRAFCIRAVAAGFELFVDTYYPAFHIYRECYLAGVEDFKKYGFNFDKDYDVLSLNDKIKRLVRTLKISIRCALYKRFYKDENPRQER